jgi:DNA-binding transcriptional LysR family regulator
MVAAVSAEDAATGLTIVFDARLPQARWGPLFHVFRLEQPHVRLRWRPTGFPTRERALLEDADVGLFLEPPPDPQLSGLTLEISPMIVVVGAGHRLADRDELTVAEILDDPFPGGPNLHPEWISFWTLDQQRGRPPSFTADDVKSAEDGLEVVAAGRAIATLPAGVAGGLAHPGIVALSLRDGPQVRTRLVWRSDDDNPIVRSLIDLATVWTRDRRGTQTGDRPSSSG